MYTACVAADMWRFRRMWKMPSFLLFTHLQQNLRCHPADQKRGMLTTELGTDCMKLSVRFGSGHVTYVSQATPKKLPFQCRFHRLRVDRKPCPQKSCVFKRKRTGPFTWLETRSCRAVEQISIFFIARKSNLDKLKTVSVQHNRWHFFYPSIWSISLQTNFKSVCFSEIPNLAVMKFWSFLLGCQCNFAAICSSDRFSQAHDWFIQVVQSKHPTSST